MFWRLRTSVGSNWRRTFSSIEPGISEKNIRNAQSPDAKAPNKRTLLRRIMPNEGAESRSNDTVIAVTTAEEYNMSKLSKFLASSFPKVSFPQQDVVHVPFSVDADGFIFSDGCFVLWGNPASVSGHIIKLKELVRPFEADSYGEAETETLFYTARHADRFHASMKGEAIVIESADGNGDPEVIRAKLAFSHGLVDSVKIGVLENALHGHIERVKYIPRLLAGGHKLRISRAKVLELTGELLQFRGALNLHSELIDTPDQYWSEPQLEALYQRVSRVLDIRQRAQVLNSKLDYANEMAAVLRQHLSEQHGLKLEWGIIVLIAVEVAFETLHWFSQ